MLACVTTVPSPVLKTTKSGVASLSQKALLMLKENLAGYCPAPTLAPLPMFMLQSLVSVCGGGDGLLVPTTAAVAAGLSAAWRLSWCRMNRGSFVIFCHVASEPFCNAWVTEPGFEKITRL